MRAEVFWVESEWGRLAVMPRPRGGDWLEDELIDYKAAGIELLVSALTPAEELELELTDEAQLADVHKLAFVRVPIEDRTVPDSDRVVLAVAEEIAAVLRAGGAVGIHCRAGVGRAAIIAAAALTRLGIVPAVAIERIAAARGQTVPDTEAQRAWILNLRLVE